MFVMTSSGGGLAIAGPYSIDILITPYHPNIVDSWLFDINNNGQSAGYIIEGSSSGARKAVLYRAGVVQVLGNGPGTIRSINSQGDAVGDFGSAPTFIAAGGAVTPIEVVGSFASLSVGGAFPGLNDSGAVLIGAFPDDPADAPPSASSDLALWSRGGADSLAAIDPLYPYTNPPDPADFLSGPSSSSYTASTTPLNNANQFAAGVHRGDFDPMDPMNEEDDVFTDVFTQAYIFDGQGGYKLLAALAPGDEIRPVDIDEAGVVLGWSGGQLVLWNSSGALLTAFSPPAQPINSSGFAGYPSVQRNNLGQIVGMTIAGGVQLYDPTTNLWTDITPSITGLGTGTFSSIQSLNDLGQFVGLLRPPAGGGVYGYVVSPVPEPRTWELSGIGLICCWALSRHRKTSKFLFMARRLAPSVLLGIVLLSAPASQAATFTYAFTGEVTVVENPNGFFADAAAVGAPVIGSFTYTDSPNQGPFAIDASFTNYTHFKDSADPELILTIGGLSVVPSDFSVTNMIVGDNNATDTFPPFFPVGDSFRYVDALDGSSALFDVPPESQPQHASGELFLIDSTGGVFGSQALPSGLPLTFFNVRFGIVDLFNDNFEPTGRVTFRIDSLSVVPEPNSLAICGAALTFAAFVGLRKLRKATSPMALLVVALLATTVGSTALQAATKTWTDGDGNWSVGANWSGGTVPLANDLINFSANDGVARTLTYDVAAPNLGLMYVDLTGPGATASTLSLPNNFNLTNGGIVIGGSSNVALTNGRGAVTQSGGTVTTAPVVGDVVLGYGASSTGVYTLTGGALVNSLNEYVGIAGAGTFNHSGGTNTINASATGALILGTNVGSTGTYNLSGSGVLVTNASQNVGGSGMAEFNQTGGTNTITGAGHHLYIGRNTSGSGFYNISGTASLSSAGDVVVGNNGFGSLTIQDQASVYIANNLSIRSGSNVALNGGALRFNTVGGTGGVSRIIYTAGTIQLAGNRTIGFDSTIDVLFPTSTISAGKMLTVEGNSSIQLAIETVSGGEFVTNGALTVGVTNTPGYLKVLDAGKVIVGGNASIAAGDHDVNQVSGAGSTWTIGGGLTIGASSLTIQNQGVVDVGGAISFSTGSINDVIFLDGGTLRFSSFSDPSRLAYTSGTIQLSGDRNLGADAAVLGMFGDFLGALPTIPTGKQLTVEGTAMIPAASLLTLSGGTLAAVTTLLSPGSRLTSTATSQVSGTVLALAGSTIDASGGNLTLGDATRVNGFGAQGTLQVGANTVTLLDANDAVFDSLSLTTLGSGGSPGTLAAANGLTLDFGGNLTGFGTGDTPNDIAKPLINNGHITGDSGGAPISLPGYVKGVGTFDNVVFTGTFAPGLSPTNLQVGSISLSSTSTLVIELGGTTPGSGYDQLTSSGTLNLDGTLQLALINGFLPTAGQTFDIFNGGDTIGAFSALILPAVPGLAWDMSQLQTGLLSIGITGDYSNDGTVDAADYTIWRDALGTGAALPNDTTPGSVTAADYDVWKNNFGQTVAGAAGATSAIPEPAALYLAVLFVVFATVSPMCSRSTSSDR